MPNDPQTLQSRRAARLGVVSTFQLPRLVLPRFPGSLTSRFPELLAYDQQRDLAVDLWLNNANTALKAALAAPTNGT